MGRGRGSGILAIPCGGEVVVSARLAALLAQQVALRHPWRGAGPVGEVALRLDVAQVPEERFDAELGRASRRELAFVRKEVARPPCDTEGKPQGSSESKPSQVEEGVAAKVKERGYGQCAWVGCLGSPGRRSGAQ